MDSYTAVIYGIIQGITEFAPVSSSGHLALIPYLREIKDPGVFFDLMMHLGTAFAVILYFYKDIYKYSKSLVPAFKNLKSQDADHFFVRNFCLSTLSTVILILVIKGPAKEYGRSADLIVFNLIFFGLILYMSDRRANPTRKISPMRSSFSIKESVLIGLSQALAIFPGVSRSGITMTAGRYLGLNRKEASSYSFLLSLPIIFAGIIYKAPEFLKVSYQEDIYLLVVGISTSFVCGLLTIHFFLKFISRTGLWVFTVYRIIIGLLLLRFIS